MKDSLQDCIHVDLPSETPPPFHQNQIMTYRKESLLRAFKRLKTIHVKVSNTYATGAYYSNKNICFSSYLVELFLNFVMLLCLCALFLKFKLHNSLSLRKLNYPIILIFLNSPKPLSNSKQDHTP